MAKAIQVENLSKQYRLGQIGTGSLVHDMNRWWHSIRGKENPYLKIGEANDRSTKGASDYVWSLRDVGFEIEQGDSVGIIGRNGAGKSTLLKILSRVTAPTTGSVKVKGRIASLLEVGTGFHPDLSGRDNIFLNGAILGMRKGEIARKFDEIVDFAGVERYIDTPVKRYSSGMYVRLAFAVAAYLESEILIVDEVLAVGDAEFQKKCLGKMGEVSKGEGRTVLFVSHNMASIAQLCNKGLALSNGEIKYSGDIESTIGSYFDYQKKHQAKKVYSAAEAPGNEYAKILEVSITNSNEINGCFDITADTFITLKYVDNNADNRNCAIIQIKDSKDNILFSSCEFNSDLWEIIHDGKTCVITSVCKIPGNLLAEGYHTVLAAVGSYSPDIVHAIIDQALSFTIIDLGNGKSVKKHVAGNWPGMLRPMLNWDISKQPYANK